MTRRMKPGRRDLILKICRTARMSHEPAQERFTLRQLRSLALWCDNAVRFNRHIERRVQPNATETGHKPTATGV